MRGERGRLAASALQAPRRERERRARHHLERQLPARARPLEAALAGAAVGEREVELRFVRRVVRDRSGRDDARVEHRGVEPVEGDRARRDSQLPAGDRHRRRQRRAGNAHLLRSEHRFVVECRRLVQRTGQPHEPHRDGTALAGDRARRPPQPLEGREPGIDLVEHDHGVRARGAYGGHRSQHELHRTSPDLRAPDPAVEPAHVETIAGVADRAIGHLDRQRHTAIAHVPLHPREVDRDVRAAPVGFVRHGA